MTRIMGLETEYGCLVDRPNESAERTVHRIKEAVFRINQRGVIDLHPRGYDEAPGNGGFLLNGGRIYIDMGHLEYATPECLSLADLVAYDRAGDRILQEAIETLGIAKKVSLIKNNIDHRTGATFGSHENYLVGREFPFSEEGLGRLIPFLVTRQIFTGAGRVGAHAVHDDWIFLKEQPIAGVDFQISQRADHIVNDFYQWVQFNRAIINTRDEPLADPNRYRRIHLLVGDSNLLEYATALKFGTTSAVLSLIEEGAMPAGLALEDPVLDLRQISRDPNRKWIVTLKNGEKVSALEIQSILQAQAVRTLLGKDKEIDWVLTEWGRTLERLAANPLDLVGKIDWITKEWLLTSFMESERIGWGDPWLASLDLEYHNIDPMKGLVSALEEEGKTVRRTTDAAIDLAVDSPPRNTRASGRGEVIRSLLSGKNPYMINWSGIYIEGKGHLPMEDPFKTYRKEIKTSFFESIGLGRLGTKIERSDLGEENLE
ncbi:MAG: proteasome accessory factor PafA2 family protein [Candidatus Manganitrophaceae bacterium]